MKLQKEKNDVSSHIKFHIFKSGMVFSGYVKVIFL